MANPLSTVATDYLVAWFHLRAGRADTPPTMSTEDVQVVDAALGRIYTRLRSLPSVADHIEALSHFPDDWMLRGNVEAALDAAAAADPMLGRDLDGELRLIGGSGGAALLSEPAPTRPAFGPPTGPMTPPPSFPPGAAPVPVPTIKVVEPSIRDLAGPAKAFTVIGLVVALSGFAIFALSLFSAASESSDTGSSPAGYHTVEELNQASRHQSSGPPVGIPVGFGMFFIGGVTAGVAQTFGRRRDDR
ncbi:MAG: hypothetical protein HOV83_36940 [Catenulispora sp.]|nr:hypothetical protein [Catenulispora sp.]